MTKKSVQNKNIEIAKMEGAIAILEKISSKTKSEAFSDILRGSTMLGYSYCLQEFKDDINIEISNLKKEIEFIKNS